MKNISFQYVKPTEDQVDLMQAFRDIYQSLGEKIQADLPDGRGKSLALTNLEQSAMWLNKGITLND